MPVTTATLHIVGRALLRVCAGTALLATTACQSAPAAAPTTAPTTAPAAKPTSAPASVAAPASSPAAAPAGSPAPAAKPAASPSLLAIPSPSAAPAAAAATFDEAAVANFYRGKTIRFIIGASPGGTSDVTARLVAQYIGKHIPGNPTVVPENRPGASGILATNAVYATEPKDGTVVGASDSSLVNAQALGTEQIVYDAAKFNWLGAVTTDATGCLARTDTGVTTLDDLTTGGKQLVVGAGAKGNNIYDVPAAINAAFGTNIRIVPGYAGVAPIRLAVQNKEVDGFCITWKAMLVSDLQWLEGDSPYAKVFALLGTSRPPNPVFRNATLVESVVKTPADRQLFDVIDAPQVINRPYFMAPEVPADRVAALRRALTQTFDDPEFKAAATAARIETSPVSGEDTLAVVRRVLATPKDVIDRYKDILK